ncbi:gp263 [Sphingomonas phage PAU]|uniref:gp263 n=1 Tax=Sphingomonas phage PAU TaxID=1150991 RepID=UPI000257340D|nr:gp263 [Sphingomonas phage PAU]AFF28261.1 gp263 [Sphingomonas phage PAU]
MTEPQNPDFGGIQLTEADYSFMTFIQSEISEDGQIPFEYPLESMPKVIKKCALFFYTEYDLAVQEEWLMIKYSDIRDTNQNQSIRLPDDIQNVYELKVINQNSCMACGNMAKFAPWGMLSYMSGPMNGSYSSISRQRSTMFNNLYDREMGFQEGLIRMFEVQQYESLFTKGVRFNYNQNTHKLLIQGAYNGDLVLSVFKRIPPEDLYNDRLFIEYVTAACLMRVKRIINSFDFQYPGNVKLNVDEITADAKERFDKVEDYIKETSNGSDLILMS